MWQVEIGDIDTSDDEDEYDEEKEEIEEIGTRRQLQQRQQQREQTDYNATSVTDIISLLLNAPLPRESFEGEFVPPPSLFRSHSEPTYADILTREQMEASWIAAHMSDLFVTVPSVAVVAGDTDAAATIVVDTDAAATIVVDNGTTTESSSSSEPADCANV